MEPRPNETLDEYLRRLMPAMMQAGKDASQAAAILTADYEKHTKGEIKWT